MNDDRDPTTTRVDLAFLRLMRPVKQHWHAQQGWYTYREWAKYPDGRIRVALVTQDDLVRWKRP